jgi:asparagine synthetase B (glutamine-hydrolysing)
MTIVKMSVQRVGSETGVSESFDRSMSSVCVRRAFSRPVGLIVFLSGGLDSE